jgi:hypothetical protein
MAHVFLSYTSKDRQLAERVAKLLEALGFEVWWEPKIAPGMSWQDEVARALHGMDCMVVLWSRDSGENNSVREQAEEGRRRGVLLPVLAEKISPPLGFRDISCVDFSAWDGSGDAPEFRSLLSAVRSRTGVAPEPAPERTSSAGTASAPQSAGGRAVSTVTGAIGTLIDFMRPSRYRREKASGSGPPVRSGEPPRETAARGPLPKPDAVTDGRDAVVATRSRERSRAGSAVSEPVLLGVAAPRQAQPGSSFTARFAAYISAAKAAAQEHLQNLGEKDDRVVTDIAPDREPRWRIGAPVTVRLTGDHVAITPPERSFEWNGRENLATFAVTVASDAPITTIQLCYHVFLGPLEIAFIPVGVTLSAAPTAAQARQIEVRVPSSAFASYASKDAEPVTRSLSTLAHWAPTLDIFQDCLDLTPNEEFKPKLEAEIAAREVFLLFWSRNAGASKWVLWEFETARSRHGLKGILPIPLEDPAIAPPPPGFEEKHLRDRFMIAGYGLKKIAEVAGKTTPPSP